MGSDSGFLMYGTRSPLRKVALAGLIAFGVLSILATSGGGDGVEVGPDTTPLWVGSTIPANGAVGVAVDAAVVATFGETVDLASVTTTSFLLREVGGNLVPGSVAVSGATVTFTPAVPLITWSHTATLTTGIRNLAGNTLVSDYSWRFTTGGADTASPSVSATTPANGESCVAVDGNVTAKFSEPMRSATINDSTFLLRDAFSSPVSGELTYANNQAMFEPYQDLAYSSFYSATVTTGAKDWAGNPMVTDYAWTFTTATPTGSWLPTMIGEPPSPQAGRGHTAIWTGREMIVWGGNDKKGLYLNSGSRYDPLADSWVAMSTDGAPSARVNHAAVWTGKEMIVWGGFYPSPYHNTGGRYDPVSDTWSPTSVLNAPSLWKPRAVWTGSEMIVLGKEDTFPLTGPLIGARYDPVSDSWRAISTIGAPTFKTAYSVVWTGTGIIAWGDRDLKNTLSSTGARYDPHIDTWTPISDRAPLARISYSAVWTGSEMIVWGGEDADGKPLNTGGRYNPLTDSWQPLTLSCVPRARLGHVAVWTGSRMVIWGGYDGTTEHFESGAAYDPATDSWNATPTLGVPGGRVLATVVWAGDRMIVWGGRGRSGYLNTGGSYSP